MAIGMLASELCDPESIWHGTMLTFDAKPQWVDFPKEVPAGAAPGTEAQLPSVFERVTRLE